VILQEFGVVSRAEIKHGRLLGVSKAELIEALNEFLLSLQRLGAQAVLIIDEAQNLPLQVLEQIRILSNLETEKEKLLQIVLVGQSNLKDLLRRAELRQLDQRVSIRYDLKPLSADETSQYVQHRISVAGGGAAVTFTPKSLRRLHACSMGIPRLINLLCDRALLSAYSAHTPRIIPSFVDAAAESLEIERPRRTVRGWVRQRFGAFAAGAALAAMLAVAAAVWHYHLP